MPVVISEFYSPRINNNGVGELTTSLGADEHSTQNNQIVFSHTSKLDKMFSGAGSNNDL